MLADSAQPDGRATPARSGDIGRAGQLLLAVIAAVSWSTTLSAVAAQAQHEKAAKRAAPSTISSKPKIALGGDPGGVAVAIIGTGVNYMLPAIASRLARDGEGDIIGLDFIDRDTRPFDVAGADTTANAIRPFGTTLASMLLTACDVRRIIPVRIRMGEPRAFGGAAAFVASTPARIVLLPFASPHLADWEPFEQAAKAAAHVLFVIPAGDDGQNLDTLPRYPASLKLTNAIVVTTAADSGGQLSPEANRGRDTVDLAVPASGLDAQTFEGQPIKVGGSAYAAARIAQAAARVLATEPMLPTSLLKAKIVAHAKTGAEGPATETRFGVIEYQNDGARTACASEPKRF